MQNVCHKLADLLPKRLGITPLLPPIDSHTLLALHFCHQDIRNQLRVRGVNDEVLFRCMM